ncbi:MAG: hypothetical protein ACR2MG_07610 [Pyrinomonadaceae bacterium]
MNKSKITFLATSFLFVCLLSLTNSFAQTETPRPQMQAEPSYEVVLHILTASNNTGDKTSVPQSLSNVVKKLKNTYLFSNYHLDSTYLQRTAGSIELKSVSSATNQNQETSTPIFSEWMLGGLRSFPNTAGKNLIQFQNFRFGQRVPIRTSAGVVNYEQTGITLQKFGVSENVPTVIGSLTTSKPDELMFLVLTVRPVEE